LQTVNIACGALLFDMDGVLIDSTHAVARVWRRWAAEHGFDPDYVAQIAQGRPSISTIRELLPTADHEAENRIVERREIEDLEGVVACSGAKQLLASLPPDRWALVTSSTRPLAEVRLKAAGLATPKFFITGSDIVRGKPHPEPFLKAADMLSVPPADCLVVEDTPPGIQAGRAAGARVIALSTTMSDAVLADAGPDWIVDSCASITLRAVLPGGELCLAVSDVRQVERAPLSNHAGGLGVRTRD
jgi:sugar-phosphatase